MIIIRFGIIVYSCYDFMYLIPSAIVIISKEILTLWLRETLKIGHD